MRIAVLIARVLLAVPLIVFGLNGFLGFIPQPEPTGQAAVYFGGLMASGFTLPLVAATEVVVGILVLIGRWVPLALIVLVPVMLNAFLYHAFLDVAGIAPSVVVLALTFFLMWAYRDHYSALKNADAKPRTSSVEAG